VVTTVAGMAVLPAGLALVGMAAISFRIKEWAWTACRTPLAFVIVLNFIQMAGTGDQTYRLVGYTADVAISRVVIMASSTYAADKRDVLWQVHAVTCPSSQEEKDSEETEIEVAETEATEAS
jgi:hypothetical protein